MISRLLGLCLELLASAAAIYMAVHLIESVASPLVVILAAIGAVLILGMLGSFFWRRYWSNRW